ncbi:MAG: D-tyrosyl-tRNA(Tyr) deacylase [Aeromicrobium sp.]|jgi:D-tyrosyl-tRNA(Tyr) deacylase|uniref:D-aminoacyl-tRNA deacylase n=1 Tax=Aeromicrobium sp. TaxID=1871063 RepID=UPI00262A498D|nr:D-aminoacyl-tRNA deacylase [Aeromicrobium sp.]MCW2787901.1 D-tyrosyl-tRNA(Tyr) deacylase [Aeromicrobium sp.]MCW2825210.1 D-tyrosyl-tRNA(Tyr) deacylase [Aeromicrobium sp.]
MRAVVQRVTRARVDVGCETVGEIGTGLMVLLGVTHDDTAEAATRLAAKIWNLRILRDERSAEEVGAGILVVSQFTLYGDTRKGRRPTWTAAAPGAVAEPLYAEFCSALRRLGATVAEGVFGADMQITLTNDGPTTLVLEV